MESRPLPLPYPPPPTPPPRSQIRPGVTVDIVQKQDQPTGRLTRGVVAQLLTKSATHPHGIKVRLTSGQVGRVQAVVGGEEG
ncbi:YwbE family protein [Deinococcus planocerae]|uniref:YwbE family protein n=1 Tax=Deinococcus planocerae TaxID=1737569 RepID=UPI000C7F215C|nr:YwbE family protein [Deinococcus planocerae]